jgi:hypothetical protein
MSNDLDVAFELFYWDGIYATAVDRAAAEARVSPTLPFLIALAEYPDASAQAHATAVEPKAWVRSHLRELTGELGVGEQAEVLGDQRALLAEGIYVSVQALGIERPVAQARGASEARIDAATTSAGRNSGASS